MTRTEENLKRAIISEAKARLEYIAFALKAMEEGLPEYAQLFMEASGAETIHGINHLRAAGGVRTTFQNLDESANAEDFEIEEMYPQFIREAEEESRPDAAASFTLALERELHHRAMFKRALDSMKRKAAATA
ncbi:MAG TPA: rubrerythrin family protein [Pyrinomonadaceae bacterium]